MGMLSKAIIFPCSEVFGYKQIGAWFMRGKNNLHFASPDFISF